MVSILKGAVINMFGTASHLIIAFVYSVFLARVLDPEVLGRYFIGFTVLNFLSIVAILGLDFTIWRYVPMFIGDKKPDKARGVVISALILSGIASLIIAVILFFGAGWLSAHFFHDNNLTIVFRMFAAALPLTVWSRLLNASTQGLRIMRYQVMSKDLGEQISKFALSGALIAFGLVGILLANIVAAGIAACLALYFLQKRLPIGFGNHAEFHWNTVVAFSTPLLFSTVFSYVAVWFDTIMLAFFRDSYEVALYGIANRVAIIGVLVLTAFNTMFSPVIADLYNRSENKRLSILFKFVTKWAVTISFPIFVMVVMFASPALNVFGDQYTAAAVSLVILAIGQFINSFTGPVAGMVLMSGRPYLDLANNLTAFLINAILCLLLIRSMGMVGAAIANATATGFVNILRAIEVYLLMGLHGYNRAFLKAIVSAVASGIITYGVYLIVGILHLWLLGLLALLFIFCYVSLLILMGFEEDDVAVVKLIKHRLTPQKTTL